MNYNEIKSKIKSLQDTQKAIDSQQGGLYRDIDKCGLSFTFVNPNEKIKHTGPQGSEAHIRFNAYHGYYGNSSCSDDMSPELADYVVAALNKLRLEIIAKAMEIIDKDITALAKEAAKEAETILKLSGEYK